MLRYEILRKSAENQRKSLSQRAYYIPEGEGAYTLLNGSSGPLLAEQYRLSEKNIHFRLRITK